jgi:hypothetical protein
MLLILVCLLACGTNESTPSDVKPLGSTRSSSTVPVSATVDDAEAQRLAELERTQEETRQRRVKLESACEAALDECKDECLGAIVRDDEGNRDRSFEYDCEDACDAGHTACMKAWDKKSGCSTFLSTCSRRCPSHWECEDACKDGAEECE